MKEVSSTHWEKEDGVRVTIQHCEYRTDTGEVCDAYLGVNYPSYFCPLHRPKK